MKKANHGGASLKGPYQYQFCVWDVSRPDLRADGQQRPWVGLRRRPVEALLGRKAPLPKVAVVVQAGAQGEAQAQARPRASALGRAVQETPRAEALGAGQGRGPHGAAEGELGAGQVLAQQSLDGRGALQGAEKPRLHPALGLAEQGQGEGLWMVWPTRGWAHRVVCT